MSTWRIVPTSKTIHLWHWRKNTVDFDIHHSWYWYIFKFKSSVTTSKACEKVYLKVKRLGFLYAPIFVIQFYMHLKRSEMVTQLNPCIKMPYASRLKSVRCLYRIQVNEKLPLCKERSMGGWSKPGYFADLLWTSQWRGKLMTCMPK